MLAICTAHQHISFRDLTSRLAQTYTNRFITHVRLAATLSTPRCRAASTNGDLSPLSLSFFMSHTYSSVSHPLTLVHSCKPCLSDKSCPNAVCQPPRDAAWAWQTGHSRFVEETSFNRVHPIQPVVYGMGGQHKGK
ncbi:hypothetical protein TcWFU_005051 [Taenia crassiceps]|uniref:Uncharacterized protein n=1 Tax=Taenia crassiceps TaxID=6207 RepID=A0ABR4QDA9_9CEST